MRSLVILFCVLLFPVISYAQPMIVFDAETKDYGKVTAGELIEQVFDVRNAGDQELIIEKLVPS
jgi:hypothetical protein